jgi:hypothetical protein
MRLECPDFGPFDHPAQKAAPLPRILDIDDQSPVRAAIMLALQAKDFDVVGAKNLRGFAAAPALRAAPAGASHPVSQPRP